MPKLDTSRKYIKDSRQTFIGTYHHSSIKKNGTTAARSMSSAAVQQDRVAAAIRATTATATAASAAPKCTERQNVCHPSTAQSRAYWLLGR
jgi:hypothetical protein